MYSFHKQQTTTQASVEFPYLLDDIMPIPTIGDIVKSDKGREFRVTDIDTISCQFDIDGTLTEQHGESYFHTKTGKLARVSVVEYYERGTPQFALYRFYRTSYTIRVA